jgi:hypothetical protein
MNMNSRVVLKRPLSNVAAEIDISGSTSGSVGDALSLTAVVKRHRGDTSLSRRVRTIAVARFAYPRRMSYRFNNAD